MAIPDHVKKQAMDAINDRVTTAQIRLYTNNDKPVAQKEAEPEKPAPETRLPIPDEVKKEAMDSIKDKGTQSQIRLIESEGVVAPVGAPSKGSGPLAQKIARMHQVGHSADAVHQQITKDDFGRDCG